MLNLFVSYPEDSWDSSPYTIEKSRFCEHTRQDIRERYLDFQENPEKIADLKSIPCIFAIENEQKESRVGIITDLKEVGKDIEISFIFDQQFPPIPKGKLKELMNHFDINKWELSRTHWAIKDVNPFLVLSTFGLLGGALLPVKAEEILTPSDDNIFIVHGHDTLMREDVKKFISTELKLNPIILSESPNQGMTIIEKLERYASKGYGIILYSPCDIGGKKDLLPVLSYRARQNVVFEHGYLIGRLGRDKVIALQNGDLETPSDLNGVVHIKYQAEGWKEVLRNELQKFKKR